MNAVPVLAFSMVLVGAHARADSPLYDLDQELAGTDALHALDLDHPQAYLYHSGFAVGGICLGDVNGDSLLDLYLVSGPGQNMLTLADTKGGFRIHDGGGGLAGGPRWGSGAALVDIDNDGDLDLFQCNYDSANQLFLNDGTGRFEELPGAAGLAITDASMAPYFADVDADGDLDLFLLCNRYYNPHGRPERPPYRAVNGYPVISEKYSKYYRVRPKPEGGFKVDDYGREDYFFLNEGIGEDGQPRFRDVSKRSGLRKEGFGLSAIWWDFDGDGDLDLYVANDFTVEDRLYRNEGVGADGVPVFWDVIADHFPDVTWSSMGSDFGDFDGDGLPDLIATDMSATTHLKAKVNMGELSPSHRRLLEVGSPRQAMRNHLFLNSGVGMFREAAWISKIASTNWSWTPKFGDLDNDGWVDLFVSNGMARNYTDADHVAKVGDVAKARIGHTEWELFKDGSPMFEENLAFRNLKGKKFEKRSDWGLGLVGMSYSAAMGDLDNDGDLDIVVSDLGKRVKIYRNGGNSHRGLRVSLTGTRSNRMGIGARVVVTDSEGVKRTRWQNPWTGFLSQHDTVLHFGLGRSEPRRVEIYWPSGLYQDLPVAPGKTLISVVEASSADTPIPPVPKRRFAPAAMADFTHKEVPFDDFERQPLLPSKLSQHGPCLAAGDIDLDGDTDFFVGGARRQTAAVFINEGGQFARSEQTAFDGLARYAEDNAALWFDADGDSDLDLLVVTGSVESELGSSLYHDFLYINERDEGGKVVLQPAPAGAFPKLADSGSCACAADFDGDGDLDLFIGSRSIPGQYPLTPTSRLLRNDSKDGKVAFTEVTPEGLKGCGMVTDAQWVDLDSDGDPDLAVAIDWGPVAVFQNDGGSLTDVTSTAGTASLLGWWGALEAVDIDGDGDLDLVAGNTGINTKYKKPTSEAPAMIYYGDMDGSGSSRIVEAKYQKGDKRPLPVRGRS